MVVGVDSTAMFGEGEDEVVHPRSCVSRLPIGFNGRALTACSGTRMTNEVGPPLIARARRITLRRAVQMAAAALRDQEDQAGQPCILHALSVMNACSTEDERIVAMLHPVVERGQCTLDALRCEGLPDELVKAVDALTRRPEEAHDQSARRAACHPISQAVATAMLYADLRAAQARPDAGTQWRDTLPSNVSCRSAWT